MGVNWDRLRGAFGTLRGVSDIQAQVETPELAKVPRAAMERFVQTAALSCTHLCRRMILGNMAAAGINSDGLTTAINQGEAVYWAKRGVVRFRLSATINPYGKRPGGVWMVAAAQDAGRVAGLKGISAQRAKKRIKAGVADAKTTRAVRQVHNGRVVTRAALDLSGLAVVPGKNFFEFSAGQSAQIAQHFRKNLNGLIKKHGHG